MSMANDDKRRGGDPDDLPPTGGEARAQRKATSMPLVWLVVGVVLVAGFVAVIARSGGGFHIPSLGPAPVKGSPPA
jgi:hypothetical protein